MKPSKLMRDIEHWTRGSASFIRTSAAVGDLIVGRHGGTVREVTGVLPQGQLQAKDARGRFRLITRPEEFRVMKRAQFTISEPYGSVARNKASRIVKTGEKLAK